MKMTPTITAKRRFFWSILVVTTMTFILVARAKSQETNWQQIPVPTLPAFHPPQPKRIQLSNGMVIFLQEDHELPLISGTARIRGGSSSEPAAKVGLVGIFGEVWRTGGTKTQTGDQLDDFLEVRAAKVETGGGPDSTTISLSCLKGDFDDVFKVFADLPTVPTIPMRARRSTPPSQPSHARICSTGTKPTFILITSSSG
jgi:zinc protease